MLDSLVRVSRRVLRVPKAVASPTGIVGSGARGTSRPRLRPVKGSPFCQQRTRTGDGARSVPPGAVARACDGLDAKSTLRGLIPCEYRRAAGRATEGLPRAVLPATRQTPHSGRRPTPSESRRPTRGEVHDDDVGRARTVACPRANSRDIAHRREANAADDESPRSIFWVS